MARPSHRRCSGCDKNFRFNTRNFHRNARNKYGLSTQCKTCVRQCQRAYEDRNQAGRRGRFLKRRYNITEEDYRRLRTAQDGCCAVCGDEGSRLVVDHCHESGAVRGLLCAPCNKGLGHFRDDPNLLERAKTYLRGSVPTCTAS